MAQYPYKTYYSHKLVRYASCKSDEFDSLRVMVSIGSTFSTAWMAKDVNTCEDVKWVEVKSEAEGINLINYLNSNFVKYISKQYRHGKNQIEPLIVLPIIDFTRTWTDAELYAHFGLTQEEIDYVESTVK